jgi:transcriptional regulator with XRE-family HTH domain
MHTYGCHMNTSTLNRTVASNVSEAMRTAGGTLSSVALATGIHRTTLTRRLTGNSSFAIAELELLAKHFGTTADAFLRAEVQAA